MAAASCSKPKRLLKCFCGCNELTEDEVKIIYRLSCYELLRNKKATELFQNYLRSIKSRAGLRNSTLTEADGDLDHKSDVEKYLDVYQICDKFLNENRIVNEDDIETLSDHGILFYQEERLTAAMKTESISEVQDCLRRIQSSCRCEIEVNTKFADFRNALLDKLKKNKKH